MARDDKPDPRIKAAARVYAADHDWHPCIVCLMRRFSYTIDEAIDFIAECRAEMRRLGRPPTPGQRDCPLSGFFRS